MTETPSLDRASLEEQRDFLLSSLRDLEHEHDAGDLDDADYAALKDEYTVRAATVLRALEAGRPARVARRRRPWGRIALGSAAIVALAVVAGFLVARSSGTRLPGDTLSGSAPTGAAARLAQARALQATSPVDAVKAYEDVLKIEPDNVEALTYLGWLFVRAGSGAGSTDQGKALIQQGEAQIDRAIQVNPKYPDAQCFKAIVAFRVDGDAATALPFVSACINGNPPQVVASLVATLKTDIEAALASTTSASGAVTTTASGGTGTTVPPSTTMTP